MLREILGRYLELEPDRVRFGYGLHGKPSLAMECGGKGLRFSLSHSHDQVLYAVTCGREVGIDLERIRPDRSHGLIAQRCFSHRELAVLSGLPVRQRSVAFYAGWTRKEAYLKAKGNGLSIPLRQVEVSLAPGDPVALLSTPWGTEEASVWSSQALNPGRGYVATLVVEGDPRRLRCWQWSGPL
jgi:4'-phosphopantetheinyl transferase